MSFAAKPLLLIGVAAAFAAVVGRALGASMNPSKPQPPFIPPAEGFSTFEKATQCDPVAKPGALAFRLAIQLEYGEPAGAGQNIVRACTGVVDSEHHEGRAWDWFPLTPQHVDTLMSDLSANNWEIARRAGIMSMIWQGQIWRSYNHPAGQQGQWGPYSGKNKHVDHVHFSFSKAGGAGQTSFYLDPLVSSWKGLA